MTPIRSRQGRRRAVSLLRPVVEEVVGESPDDGGRLLEEQVHVVRDEEARLVGVVLHDVVADGVVLAHDAAPVQLLGAHAQPAIALQVVAEHLEPLPHPLAPGDLADRSVQVVVLVKERASVAPLLGVQLAPDDVDEELGCLVRDPGAALHRDFSRGWRARSGRT